MSHDAARDCALGANAVVGAHGVHAAADGIEWKARRVSRGADRKGKGSRDAHVGGFGGPMGSAAGADSTHAATSARATRPTRRARAIADILRGHGKLRPRAELSCPLPREAPSRRAAVFVPSVLLVTTDIAVAEFPPRWFYWCLVDM